MNCYGWINSRHALRWKIVQTVNIQVVVLHLSEDTVTLMCVCVYSGNKETNSSYIEDWSRGKLSLKTLHR